MSFLPFSINFSSYLTIRIIELKVIIIFRTSLNCSVKDLLFTTTSALPEKVSFLRKKNLHENLRLREKFEFRTGDSYFI